MKQFQQAKGLQAYHVHNDLHMWLMEPPCPDAGNGAHVLEGRVHVPSDRLRLPVFALPRI